jgi:hypothetical protein
MRLPQIPSSLHQGTHGLMLQTVEKENQTDISNQQFLTFDPSTAFLFKQCFSPIFSETGL